jgi:PAS domain S-box-containing protein
VTTDSRDAASQRGEQSAPHPHTAASAQLLTLRAHRLFEALADNVRDYAVFLLDTDGIIRYWGEGARLMKWWSKEQAEGEHLRILYPEGGSEDGTAESHLAASAELGEYTGEGHRVRNDGSTFWAGVTLTALRDDDGTLLGFVKVTRDFTARRAAEATMKAGLAALDGQQLADETSRLTSLFVASVGHEIRAPLNALLGYVQLLAREAGGPARQKAHIARIESTATHLLEVVRDLLDHSRIQAGRVAMNPSIAHVGAVIESALADAESIRASRGVTLTNSISGAAAELPFWGDATRVRQIIVNLLSNAIKYTPGTGAVTISAGTADSAPGDHLTGLGPWVWVRVEDNGEGIPPDRLTAIFEPFEQATPAHAHRGTGLGLSISRRLARLMGGDLTVHSEPGQGSQFVLWLPVAATDTVPR